MATKRATVQDDGMSGRTKAVLWLFGLGIILALCKVWPLAVVLLMTGSLVVTWPWIRLAMAKERVLATTSGVEFENRRLFLSLSKVRDDLSARGLRPSLGRVTQAFQSAEAMELAVTFARRHLDDFQADLSSSRLGAGSEKVSLFLKLMEQKHGVRRDDLVMCVIYISVELAYGQYRREIDARKPEGLGSLLARTALHDIYAGGHTHPSFIARYAAENSFEKRKEEDLNYWYHKELEKLRVGQMEKDLKNSGYDGRASVDERIRFATKEEFFRAANLQKLDTAPEGYIIVATDHSRASRIDSAYRRLFRFQLIEHFDMRCAKCQELTTELELDHFWLPKAQGGNFAMRSKSGVYTNNCIPLCRSCNASKGARHFLEFFGLKELETIIEKSQAMNAGINANLAELEDEAFQEARKTVA